MMQGPPELPETPSDLSYRRGIKDMEGAYADGVKKLRECFQGCLDNLDFTFHNMMQKQDEELKRNKKNAAYLHNYYSDVHAKLLAMKQQI
mmetsp:Transcript_24349/g.37692  ORF Transcript_24349/g.37692 Transcript_24349/m.37692 type:complete len:90 (+) Transcript_24349:258-527(+)